MKGKIVAVCMWLVIVLKIVSIYLEIPNTLLDVLMYGVLGLEAVVLILVTLMMIFGFGLLKALSKGNLTKKNTRFFKELYRNIYQIAKNSHDNYKIWKDIVWCILLLVIAINTNQVLMVTLPLICMLNILDHRLIRIFSEEELFQDKDLSKEFSFKVLKKNLKKVLKKNGWDVNVIFTDDDSFSEDVFTVVVVDALDINNKANTVEKQLCVTNDYYIVSYYKKSLLEGLIVEIPNDNLKDSEMDNNDIVDLYMIIEEEIQATLLACKNK